MKHFVRKQQGMLAFNDGEKQFAGKAGGALMARTKIVVSRTIFTDADDSRGVCSEWPR
jgi:hypothetical protein